MLTQDQAYRLLSEKRFRKYMVRCSEDIGKALLYYEANIKVSESTYSALNCLEITLRNQIHERLIQHHKTFEWYNQWMLSDDYSDFHDKIQQTKNVIRRRKETVHSDKMVAEFTLGFWIQMFNAEYDELLWKPLRTIFRNLKKEYRKRRTVSSALNRARIFRNRIYHYEPVCWNFRKTKENYDNVIRIIQWLDNDQFNWVSAYCEFNDEIRKQTNRLKETGLQNVDFE